MFDIPCVIFAGGKSSRMGEDKSLLPFSSFTTLTEYQYSKLSQFFRNVYISTKESTKFDFQADFIEDIADVYAPTLGFISIFKSLKAKKVFVISVDTPFISQEIIQQILEEDSEDYDATIARLDGKIQPLCGVYHISLLNKFEKMLADNEHKLGYLLKSSKTHYVNFEDTQAFSNLNHPHEYQAALQQI
jgi:molybdopterin-guanine dinucleotide biosynthesis protein A